ncbi:hypothetical protein AB0942_33445 [Streptomyces nodosus]|uniref:hypothetical protein n=1 Tax=Streptomyces nodosus TaxID=40318 RepID=UPI003454249C
MSENTPETVQPDVEAETESWGEDSSSTYPEFHSNPHNHRFTISMNGQGPMVVIRANTGAEFNAALEELREEGCGAALGSFWSDFKAAAMVANGLGGATQTGSAPAPAGPPAPPQMGAPTPPPFGPNVSVPGAPGFQGAPQGPGVPANFANPGGHFGAPAAPAVPQTPPEYAQAGWYRLTVPFKQKAQFDAITAQFQMRKGRPSESGQFSFNKADKSWYVDPQYAGAFPQFSPVPA